MPWLLNAGGLLLLYWKPFHRNWPKKLLKSLKIPTIGIGAGIDCDGQVLVINDLLGLSGKFRPKFVKQYVQLEPIIKGAVSEYVNEVKKKKLPKR